MWKQLLRFFCNKTGSAPSMKNKRILVVDDGDVERKFIVQSLQKAGCVVLEADSGSTGLEIATKEKPDMIILDYMMPNMDGNEVCRKLKAENQTKNIPVIFLTGSTRPETVITCYDVGAEHYLAKPISAKTLLNQVKTTLEGIESVA